MFTLPPSKPSDSMIPVISVANLTSPERSTRVAAAKALGHACREVGFFYAAEHFVSEELMQAVFREAEAFFSLSPEQKELLSIKRSGHNRGYVGLADERLNPKAGADRKEAFNIGTEFAADHPDALAGKPFRGPNFWPKLVGFRATLLVYFRSCLELGRLLHRGIGLDLGVGEDFFGPYLSDPIATLRLLHYPASVENDPRPDGAAGMHTDYGNLTLLATDGVPGLQVATRSGQWSDAPNVPGAFLCNIGDCLMRWTNDTYVSTPHRVRSPSRERYSVAFFLEANPDSVVDPRDVLPKQRPKYPPVTCSDYLASRLDATYSHRGQG